MRLVFTLWVAILTLTSGCQSGPETRYTGWLGPKVEGEEVDLSAFEPPRDLKAYQLQGEMDFPERKMRMFRYRHDEHTDQKLDIALYPLPEAFSEMSGEKAVGGHYGTVKQKMAQRLTQRHDSRIELRNEQLREPRELPYPVAEGIFREIASQWTRTLVLLVSARKPVFVRATSDFAATGDDPEQARLDGIRAATRAFLSHNSVSPEAGNE